MGLLLITVVTAANLAEKKGAISLLEKIKNQFPRLKKIFSDGGYEDTNFHTSVQDGYNYDWEVVKRTQKKGFKLLPWRWVVERTFAWLMRYRRLVIDYEAWPEISEAFIYAAMVRRLT